MVSLPKGQSVVGAGLDFVLASALFRL